MISPDTASDYRIADIGLAAWGRREISLAEAEMPALMRMRHDLGPSRPLEGARIVGCLHMTVQTAVLIETLLELGAEVRWSSCNRFSTQDEAAAAMVDRGVPIYAWKGESEEDYWWCLERTLHTGAESDAPLWNPNILLDDGGDLTKVVHEQYPQLLEGLHGLAEETTTGVSRLHRMAKEGTLRVPALDVNAAVSKSKNDNRYGCRHGLNDALKRSTDMLLAGRRALVFGFGDVGKGSAMSLRQESAIVRVVEIDPICAMQACLDGYEVVSPWAGGSNTGRYEDLDHRMLSQVDFLVTATGNMDVCSFPMLKALRSGCVVCNIGHFDNEIDVESMREHWYWEEVKPQVHRIWRDLPPDAPGPDGGKDYLILLAEGRLVNLGNATGHPSRVMDGSFANQVVAQIQLMEERFAEINDPEERARLIGVRVLPRHLDELVARYMVEGQGGTITSMTDEQADYIGIPVKGPFKPNEYRY